MLHPEIAVIVMTAFATVTSAVEAMRTGADGLSDQALCARMSSRRYSSARQSAGRSIWPAVGCATSCARSRDWETSSGSSGEMEKLYRILSKVAQTTHPVLILGESGTGKELVARSIHANGPNAAKPFLPVDCGSLVPTLVESELFGYVKGAFTGANRSKDGLAGLGRRWDGLSRRDR